MGLLGRRKIQVEVLASLSLLLVLDALECDFCFSWLVSFALLLVYIVSFSFYLEDERARR